MTKDEKVEKMIAMMGDDCLDDQTAIVYLDFAEQRLLNHIYPFGEQACQLPPRYDYQHIELAIALYNVRGVEGQSAHDENGVRRTYRSVEQILKSIPTTAGLPR